jgi:hypothetical protein
MQLGTRWNVGGEPPARLPEAMVVAVRGVEDELAVESVDTATWGWTLTFLEGKPIVELDDGMPRSRTPTTRAKRTRARFAARGSLGVQQWSGPRWGPDHCCSRCGRPDQGAPA